MRRTDRELDATFTDLFLPIFRPAQRILAAARRLADAPAVVASCALSARYRSVNPHITDGYVGRSKDAVFVADALYAAGFAPPVSAGSCRDPVDWPLLSQLFVTLGPQQAARSGDLLCVDGHVEILVRLGPGPPETLGARRNGLVQDACYARLLRLGACQLLRPRLEPPI